VGSGSGGRGVFGGALVVEEVDGEEREEEDEVEGEQGEEQGLEHGEPVWGRGAVGRGDEVGDIGGEGG
jgi:hypothetical protein